MKKVFSSINLFYYFAIFTNYLNVENFSYETASFLGSKFE